jgi:hypothetical protein
MIGRLERFDSENRCAEVIPGHNSNSRSGQNVVLPHSQPPVWKGEDDSRGKASDNVRASEKTVNHRSRSRVVGICVGTEIDIRTIACPNRNHTVSHRAICYQAEADIVDDAILGSRPSDLRTSGRINGNDFWIIYDLSGEWHNYTLGAVETVPSDQEREFAKEVADYGIMAGWDKAIQRFARQSGMNERQVILILNNVQAYNVKADPKGRIDALDDWEKHKQNPEWSTPAAKGQGKTVA